MQQINYFASVVERMQNYDFVGDAQRSFQEHGRLGNELQANDYGVVRSDFLVIAHSLQLQRLGNALVISKELERNQGALDEQKKQVEELARTLRNASAQRTFENYSMVFQQQAEGHSGCRWDKEKVFRLSIGAANVWMVIGVMVSAAGLCLFYYTDFLYPQSLSKENLASYLALGERLVMISLWLFGVRFCFGQYSVNKHLYTLNKHRQNTLESFKLLLESVDSKDDSVRNALVMEVARAIYDAGKTGYLRDKDDGPSSPSLIELTRVIGRPSSTASPS